MAAPQITVTFDPPLASDSGAEFDTKAFDTVAKFNPWGVEANGVATFVSDTAVEVLATAVAGNLSELDFASAAGYFIAVNEAGTGIDAVEVVELPQASQVEAEAGVATGVYMDPLRTNQAVVATMNAAGSAPMYACRAWVNFNGTGTPTILAGGNVSSITDNGVGDYTVNFAVPMHHANYAVLGSAAWNQDDIAAAVFSYAQNWTKTVSAFRFTPSQNITASGASPSDSPSVSLAFFG